MSQLQTTPVRTLPRLAFNDALALILFRDPLGVFARLGRKYGDVVYLKTGREETFVLNHPDDIRELLVVQHENFRKGEGVMMLGRVLGNGLITNDGPSHKKQRRLVQPAFHRKRIAGYATAMVDAARLQAQIWQDGAQVDMVQEMLQLTLVIVGRTLFNTDVARAKPAQNHAQRKAGVQRAQRLCPRSGLGEPRSVTLRNPEARELAIYIAEGI